jgi:dTDP-4-amino-4,6-dideoxygalactose transaminase
VDGRAHPLVARTFGVEEVLAMVNVVLSGQLTMSSNVRQFEAEFARYDDRIRRRVRVAPFRDSIVDF